MRILFFVHGYKPAWRIGGPILSVSALAEGLVQRGHQVVVFTTDSNLDQDLDVLTDRPVDVDGVEVWYFKRTSPARRYLPGWKYASRPMGFMYAPRMRAELNRLTRTMDVLHTHLPFNYPSYAGARAARAYGKPLFYHQRGVFDPERLKFRPLKKALYMQMVEIPTLKRATTLIALTEREVQTYRNLGVETPCRIIPNGIAVADYSGAERRDLTAALGIEDGHLIVLFMGRLHPTKGAEKLLDAFLQICHQHPRAALVMAGPDEAGLERRFRAKVAPEAGKRVLFPGMVGGELKKQLLSRADLFCLPSDAEGFSMAVLEALASSTAVLLSPGCHFGEVERAGAGIVRPNDRQSIADGLTELLRNPAALKQMGLRGRALATSEYSWSRAVDAHLDAYAEGISRHHRRNSQE